MVYANELVFGAFTLKQCSSGLVIEILKIRCRLWPWLWLRLRCWQWLWVKIIMSRAIKREPKSPICVMGIGIKSWLNCLEKLSFFGCWKSLSAASKCRKTHPQDYRISKFSGGACPRTPLGDKALRDLPILCPGVKLRCPPVQNLNEPPDKEQIRANLCLSFLQFISTWEAFLLTMMVWQCCYQIYSINSMLLAFPKQR